MDPRVQDAERVVIVAGDRDGLMIGEDLRIEPNKQPMLREQRGCNVTRQPRQCASHPRPRLDVQPPALPVRAPTNLVTKRLHMLAHVLEGRFIEGRLRHRHGNAVRLALKGMLDDADLEAHLARIEADRADVQRRLDELAGQEPTAMDRGATDLFARLHQRLEVGLSDEERNEIVRLVVRIVVDTQTDESGKKQATARIEYRFPYVAAGVVKTRTDTRSSRRPDRPIDPALQFRRSGRE